MNALTGRADVDDQVKFDVVILSERSESKDLLVESAEADTLPAAAGVRRVAEAPVMVLPPFKQGCPRRSEAARGCGRGIDRAGDYGCRSFRLCHSGRSIFFESCQAVR